MIKCDELVNFLRQPWNAARAVDGVDNIAKLSTGFMGGLHWEKNVIHCAPHLMTVRMN
jgi:hypothetical protein